MGPTTGSRSAESNHGDGAAFLLKTRLVQFLHHKMGFSVLAFEASLFDCARTAELIAEGSDIRTVFGKCTFPSWSKSEQFQALFDYLAIHARSATPLEVAGVDFQPMRPFVTELQRQFGGIVSPDQLPADTWTELFDAVRKARDPSYKGPHEDEKGVQILDRLATALERNLASVDRRKLDLLRQTLTTTRDFFVWHAATADAKRSEVARNHNGRDAAMADNLIWLAEKRFPNQKIIVWAANFHLMKTAERVQTPPELTYDGLVPMGRPVTEHFGDRAYTIALLSYEGSYAGDDHGASITPLAKPSHDSWEDLFVNARLDTAFLDVRSARATTAWLTSPRACIHEGAT
jgi:erythromycin esterase-like protein